MDPNAPEPQTPNSTEPEASPAPAPAAQPEPPSDPTPPAPSVASPIAQQFSEPPAPSAGATGQPGKLPGAFSLFKPSWEALKLNFMTWLKILVLPLALFIVFVTLAGLTHRNSSLTASYLIPVIIVMIAYSLFLGPAFLYLQVQSANGLKTDVKAVVAAARHYFWRFYGVSICAGGLILIGLVLLIVPGVIFIRRFFLAPYALIEKDGGVFDALHHSTALSKLDKGAVWGVIGVEALLAVIGIIPILGQLVSAVLNALYYFAPAIRYEQLEQKAQASPNATVAV